jgi:hypothetical protein
MCSVEGCEREARSKGLCAMHYMRQRRHGNAETVAKAGRPTDYAHDIYKEFLPEISARTRSKYAMAIRRLDATFGESYGEVQKLIGKRRTNAHRMNYTALSDDAATLHAIHLASIGKWPHELTITAEGYLQRAEKTFPDLMEIYNRFKPE